MGICDECIIKDGCKFANSGLIMKHCKNFIGEAPREIKTNFQRITSSPEALAEFIVSLEYDKEDFPNSYKEDYDNLLEWLKQESDAE